MQQDEKKIGIVIPMKKLSGEALNSLVEEFILREGTDYGNTEYSLDEKKNRVFKQLQSKTIIIMFDPQLESTTLITTDSLKKLRLQNFEIVDSP